MTDALAISSLAAIAGLLVLLFGQRRRHSRAVALLRREVARLNGVITDDGTVMPGGPIFASANARMVKRLHEQLNDDNAIRQWLCRHPRRHDLQPNESGITVTKCIDCGKNLGSRR